MSTITDLAAAAPITGAEVLAIDQTEGEAIVTVKLSLSALAAYVAGTIPAPTPVGAFLWGTGAPSNSLGVNGDGYVNIANGAVYANTAGAWAQVGSFAG